MKDNTQKWCPYPGCTFTGTDSEVDEHRTSHVHDREPQQGSNLSERPRS